MTVIMTTVHAVSATVAAAMSTRSSRGHCRSAQSDSSGNSDRNLAKHFILHVFGANAPVMHMRRATKMLVHGIFLNGYLGVL
jgi:hypothetical protein